MNVLVLSDDHETVGQWRAALEHIDPQICLVREGEVPGSTIVAALVDQPVRGRLAALPHLHVLFSMMAGVDALLDDPTLPPIPLVRLVTHDTVALMREYVYYHVVRSRRRFYTIEEDQRRRRWNLGAPSSSPSSCGVSVLGLGRLGLPSAIMLRDLGYRVAGWSRTPKEVAGIRSFYGPVGLQELLPTTNILVCLLPLTIETEGLLRADLFNELPFGASIINAGRGQCLNMDDLIAALDSGQISHATLDVFPMEPLPSNSTLWSHAGVTVTPHIAAEPTPDVFVSRLSRDLRKALRGDVLTDIVDRRAGY
jgi:glyoxylate/hydroxypyruvate reductase A